MKPVLRRSRDPRLVLAEEWNRVVGTLVGAAGGETPEGECRASHPGGREQRTPGQATTHVCATTIAPTFERGSASASIERDSFRVSPSVSWV